MLISAIALLAQTFVPAADAGQIDCPLADPLAQTAPETANHLTVGAQTLRTSSGVSDCRFHQVDQGHCWLENPGRLTVERNGAATTYDIPEGATVEFEARGGLHACRIGRRIRTHGSTIIPDAD